jgi:mercuric ion transport protein
VRNRTLIATGAVGTLVAAVCCATPLLAVLFGAIGLTAWLAKADYVLILALVLCVAVLGFGICRAVARPGPAKSPFRTSEHAPREGHDP